MPSHCTLYHKHTLEFTLKHLHLLSFNKKLPHRSKVHEHTLFFALWISEYHTGQQKHNNFLLTFLLVFFFRVCLFFAVLFPFCVTSLTVLLGPRPARPHRGRRRSSPCSAEQQGTVTVCPAWSQRRLSSISQALLTTIWMEVNLFLNCLFQRYG